MSARFSKARTIARALVMAWLLPCTASMADTPSVDNNALVATTGLAALAHNPFDRPALLMQTQALADDSRLDEAMQLRGVLVGGARSLANVDGKILAVGETIGEYTLIQVSETSAVLRSDNVTVQLALAQVEEAADGPSTAERQDTEQ